MYGKKSFDRLVPAIEALRAEGYKVEHNGFLHGRASWLVDGKEFAEDKLIIFGLRNRDFDPIPIPRTFA